MMAESIVSLMTVLITSLIDVRKRRTHSRKRSETEQTLLSAEERGDVPSPAASADDDDDGLGFRTVAVGILVSSAICVFLVSAIFGEEGIRWWATVIAIILACIFSLLGCVMAVFFVQFDRVNT
jgi:predicted permease